MVRWRPFLAAALLLSACGGSSKKDPGDTTPPAVANPQNAGLARGDKLVVRFSEPVHAVAATAVNAFDAAGVTLAGSSAFLADGTLEVTPAAPLPVPGPVEVRVENVADAAGNLLTRGSALFRVSGWVDLGYARQLGYGPQVIPRLQVARLAGVTQVVWIGGRAWSDGTGWTEELPTGLNQSLAVDGDLLLHTAWSGSAVAFSALDRGAASSLGPGPAARPTDGSLAGCRTPGSRRAVYAWMEQVATPSIHYEVKASGWEAGTWTDLALPGGEAGIFYWIPSAACAPSGTAFVAFTRFPCPAGDCLVVLRRDPGAAGWTEAHRIAAGAEPSLALDGERPAVAYSGAGGVRVERQAAQGWESLPPLTTSSSNLAREPSLVADASGVLHVAWSEQPQNPVSEPEKGRIYVAARRGADWVILGRGPVNDEVPVAAARAPWLALGDDGVLVVAYYEWSGVGDPANGDFRIRVKRYAE